MAKYINADEIDYKIIYYPQSNLYTGTVLVKPLDGFYALKDDIDAMLAADVQEVKHAKWVHYGEYTQCSNCEHVTDDFCYDDEMNMILPHYCSNCGAKMKEDKQ